MVKQEISYERKKTWSMELLLPVAMKQMWFPMSLLLLLGVVTHSFVVTFGCCCFSWLTRLLLMVEDFVIVALGWNIRDKVAWLKAEIKALLLLRLSCRRGLKRCNLC
jgi:hypothetical protein